MKPSALKNIFDFFVFSSLFVAVCAVLMVYQTCLLFSLPFSFALGGFVFSGAVCSYNFHWYLTPPVIGQSSPKKTWNISNRKIHLLLFYVGLIGSAVFSYLLIEHWIWLGVTAFFTFMYSAPKIAHPVFSHLKKVAIGKTIFLAFAWMHVTALLPLIIQLNVITEEHIIFAVNRFYFIYAICILFDYRDVEEDKEAGIRSLITYLDDKGIDSLFWGSVAVALITVILLDQYFPTATLIALLIPVIFLSLLYYPSKRNFSDYLYYVILDGLMMLSAPLLLLFKFAR